MNRNNLLTPDELNALLTTEKVEVQTEQALIITDAYTPAAPDEVTDRATDRDQDLIAELQQTVQALTFRVEALEMRLQQQTAEEECSMLMAVVEIVDLPEPVDMSTISRRESYGRKRKKKRSVWQTLLD
jgi:hypothetical protein